MADGKTPQSGPRAVKKIQFPNIASLTKKGMDGVKLTKPILSIDPEIKLDAESGEVAAEVSQPIENYFELTIKKSGQVFLVNGQPTTLGVTATDLSLDVGETLNAKVSVTSKVVDGKKVFTLNIVQT